MNKQILGLVAVLLVLALVAGCVSTPAAPGIKAEKISSDEEVKTTTAEMTDDLENLGDALKGHQDELG